MRRFGPIAGALSGFAVLACASSASAQDLVGWPDAAAAELNHFHFGLEGSATYDTNVARASEQNAALRGLTLQDEVYTTRATIDVQQPVGDGTGSLSGYAGYNFYTRNPVLNRETIGLAGDLKGSLLLCQGSLDATLSRGLNQLADTTAQQVQDTLTQASLGGTATCGPPVGFAPTASVSERWTTNSASALSVSDSRTFNVSGGVAYRSAASGVITLSGLYRRTDYPNADLDVASELGFNPFKSGYTMTGATISYERRLGARLNGSVAATYTMVRSSASGDFNGLTYRADLTYLVGSRLLLEGSFSREVLPSNLPTANYRLESDTAVDARYRLGPRLTWGVGAARQNGSESGLPAVLALELSRYDLQSIYSSLTLQLRRVSITAEIRNDRRTTDQPGFNYSDTRVSLTAGVQF